MNLNYINYCFAMISRQRTSLKMCILAFNIVNIFLSIGCQVGVFTSVWAQQGDVSGAQHETGSGATGRPGAGQGSPVRATAAAGTRPRTAHEACCPPVVCSIHVYSKLSACSKRHILCIGHVVRIEYAL